MNSEFLLFLVIGALSGGFVNGLAGFGTALFTLGWWLQIMSPIEAVALVLITSIASGSTGMVLVWHAINWQRLARFLLPALLGIPVGLHILKFIDATMLKLIVAIFLLAYGGYFGFRQRLPTLSKSPPLTDQIIGFLGGTLGAIAGLSGALPTMWCSLKPWTKYETRALLQSFNFIILCLSAFGLFINGGYDQTTLTSIFIAVPVALVAAQIGIWVFKRLSDEKFRRLLIILMLVSGLFVSLDMLI